MKKNILLVDDSALMRRVICDIINADSRFQVVETAKNGKEALELLRKKTYDAVVLDVNMPIMNGLELLKALQDEKISAKVVMASTDTREGAQVTMDALDLGAIDFVHKPNSALDCKQDSFSGRLLQILSVAVESRSPVFGRSIQTRESKATTEKVVEMVRKKNIAGTSGKVVVAIASSTGGPKALQSVIPRLPKNLNAPVLLVQHMPVGFTKSMAERLNSLSEITVKEAAEGDVLENGVVYIAMGGKHMNVVTNGKECKIHFSDEPSREGVKPCANYMYESLRESSFDRVLCVVMTGMGADGTQGIQNLKVRKKIQVIAQQEDTCAVYGMPKAVVKANLADQVVGLDNIAQEIIMNVGVK